MSAFEDVMKDVLSGKVTDAHSVIVAYIADYTAPIEAYKKHLTTFEEEKARMEEIYSSYDKAACLAEAQKQIEQYTKRIEQIEQESVNILAVRDKVREWTPGLNTLNHIKSSILLELNAQCKPAVHESFINVLKNRIKDCETILSSESEVEIMKYVEQQQKKMKELLDETADSIVRIKHVINQAQEAKTYLETAAE